MPVHLRTERLELRPLTGDDLDDLAALNGDPEVMRHIPSGPSTREQVRDEVLPRLLSYRGDFGFWAAVDRATGDFLGWFHFRPPSGPEPGIELGYRLHRRSWGRGYATEGSRALIRRGFTELGVERVLADTLAVNTASRRVLEKVGLRRVADPGPGKVRYALTRAEWTAAVSD